MAVRQPDRAALKIPRGRTRSGDIDYLTLSFRELDEEVAAWSDRLSNAGVQSGDRTLVMVRQGLPLIAAAFALFRVGAVPVIIDPGMGLASFLRCVASSRPRALVGIPLAQLVSRIFLRSFASLQTRVLVSGSPLARLSQSKIENRKSKITKSAPADLAAVLFTSGSTGAPKGVCYEHGMFEAQVEAIRTTYQIEPGEIDLPMLPIFALFNPALGMTTVVPEIDPRRPATVDPAKIVQAIQQERVTNSFGSPTLWGKIDEHCIDKQITLPTMRRVLCAGAPVPAMLWGRARSWMPNGLLHSPYGATEALPVSSVSSDEIHQLKQSVNSGGAKPPAEPSVSSRLGGNAALYLQGACVGHPLPNVAVKIIAISDDPIATLEDAKELPAGEIGEIIVSGPVVTKEYDHNPTATTAAKIVSDQRSAVSNRSWSTSSLETRNPEPETEPRLRAVWHRMGDCGYLDRDGRLWFCGRKAERVETIDGPLYTEQVEPIFNLHPDVARSALIATGHDHQRAAIVVEPRSREVVATPSLRRKLERELRTLAAAHPHTDLIRLAYLHPHFPVDVRHNAKIHRLALARWAASHHGYELDKREVSRDALKQ